MSVIENDVATAEKDVAYVVKFYDSVSGWLHSETKVAVGQVSDILSTAYEKAKEDYGLDMSTYRAAVTYADTGEGVSSLDNAATKAQLEAQLKALSAQIEALSDDAPESPSSVVKPPPTINPGFSTAMG